MQFERKTREEIIRPYSEIWCAEYPEELRSEEEVKADFNRLLPGCFEEHWLATHNGKPVALIKTADEEGKTNPERLNFELCLHPAHERELLTPALNIVDQVAERAGVRSADIWSSNLKTLRDQELANRGFKQLAKVRVTRLNFKDFDPTPFEPDLIKFGQQGMRVTTIAELTQRGRDWVPELYEASWEMIQDMPHAHSPTLVPLEHFRRNMTNPVTHDQNLMFIALDQDRIVAYSRIQKAESMPSLVRTGLSGVVRSHRRKGVITAVKVRSMLKAKEMGYKTIQTDNDETNPMFNINVRLGFKEVWQWGHWEKTY